ncbi:MAG: (Fe-S)-binding protein [Gammaproteobacteria bacterium]|nr:MAG: (Fe-S)-binding protein [Gammaproteobacteria bacterium]
MRVALFVTCLIDLIRPSAGFATIKLLEHAGCTVVVPPQQTCCGQPAYNNGDVESARTMARQVITYLEGFEHVIIPSGSCGGMLIKHYPRLLDHDPAWHSRARNLAGRCYELTQFLVDVLGVTQFNMAYAGRVAYHDSCSSSRELHIRQQPRTLLNNVAGLELCELEDCDHCCGFGGTFSVKFSDISTAIVDSKVSTIINSDADTITAGDLGCLLNIAGRLSRQGHKIKAFHIAELLAGMTEQPIFKVDEQ